MPKLSRALVPALAALATLLPAALPATAAAAPQSGADSPAPSHRSPGCGKDPGQAAGTSVDRTLTSGGIERHFRVHLPRGYRPDRPLPVVLAYHGQSRTSAYMEELTGFSALPAIAVYPQGVPGTEDGKPSWQGAPYSAPGVDDVRFTGDLISALEQNLCVDETRVHAAGKSNGGGFTALLACRMPEGIASFSIASGAFYPQAGACEPSAAAPVLDFHGLADTTIPYDGNPAKGLPAIPDWLDQRAALAGCAPDSHDKDLGKGVTRRTWRHCDDRGALAHYQVAGLAHDWPSTHPNPDSDKPTVIDASPVMWRFMQRHWPPPPTSTRSRPTVTSP